MNYKLKLKINSEEHSKLPKIYLCKRLIPDGPRPNSFYKGIIRIHYREGGEGHEASIYNRYIEKFEQGIQKIYDKANIIFEFVEKKYTTADDKIILSNRTEF